MLIRHTISWLAPISLEFEFLIFQPPALRDLSTLPMRKFFKRNTSGAITEFCVNIFLSGIKICITCYKYRRKRKMRKSMCKSPWRQETLEELQYSEPCSSTWCSCAHWVEKVQQNILLTRNFSSPALDWLLKNKAVYLKICPDAFLPWFAPRNKHWFSFLWTFFTIACLSSENNTWFLWANFQSYSREVKHAKAEKQ